METQNINAALYTLLESNNVKEIKAVRLETSKDIDSNISIGTIRFEDASGREIVMNVKIEQDADIPTI